MLKKYVALSLEKFRYLYTKINRAAPLPICVLFEVVIFGSLGTGVGILVGKLITQFLP